MSGSDSEAGSPCFDGPVGRSDSSPVITTSTFVRDDYRCSSIPHQSVLATCEWVVRFVVCCGRPSPLSIRNPQIHSLPVACVGP